LKDEIEEKKANQVAKEEYLDLEEAKEENKEVDFTEDSNYF
jgi:hypothetical protein